MSARYAIPATTFVLRALVQERLQLAYGQLAAPTVSIEPPPRPPATAANPANGNGHQPEPAGLHLFCHHLALNPAWRNVYEPHVDSTGRRRGRPSPVAVDLHYLLAATGADLEREVLLGLGVTTLNRFGIVPRPKIEALLDAVAVPPGPPTKILDRLTTELLADPAHQPQQLTVSQQPVDLDLSTKVWSAFQSPLRPSAYFLVTTVFLEIDETFPPAKDVDDVAVAVRPEVVVA